MTRLHELDAYLTGEMSEAEADAFEQALFDAPDDADLAFFDRLARHGAKLVEHGTWNIGVSRQHVEALAAAGHKVHIFDAGPPGQRTVAFDSTCDFMVTKLHLGRDDLERVDVEINIVAHDVQKTIKDVLVDRDGIIYGLCERPLAELAFGAGGRTITHVRKRDGARDIIATWDLTPAP
ncbi:MAG: hypothetical protein F9K40_10105 [Kofleriaceae bacterium]|nr:MAG: hypothetical protein F9K40_10105 [Kofleriaceae bacterium]MBZ0233383.1 hypothetical protein [Kofleriaceae bacterium]